MCTDQLFLDVTGAPEAAAWDAATLLGQDGGETLRAEELAARWGTLTNELLSRLKGRLPPA